MNHWYLFQFIEEEETEILNSRQQFLIEYYGETDIHQQQEKAPTDRIIYCPSHMDAVGDIDVSWNNTFQCIRSIDGSKLIASI